MNDDARALLAARAFDPEEIQPGELTLSDVSPHGKDKEKAKAKEKKQKNKKGAKESEGVEPWKLPLPMRVSIDELKTTVGFIKVFAERSRCDFSMQAMGKVVLPHLGGQPYMTKEGEFPCPFLSTFNAVKHLTHEGFAELDARVAFGSAEENAVEDMRRMVEGGTQVEWKEFP